MSCLIALDFDHTLFNTTAFVAAMKRLLCDEFAISEEEFERNRQYVKECCRAIDIDTFVEHLPYNDPHAVHEEVRRLIRDRASEWVFPDVRRYLRQWRDQCDIRVVTHGDMELQAYKIEHSKLGVDIPYDITLGSKADVLGEYIEEYDAIAFVDDKAQNIDVVKQAYPSVKTYFIKRPEDQPYGDTQSVCECADVTIAGLNEVDIQPLGNN